MERVNLFLSAGLRYVVQDNLVISLYSNLLEPQKGLAITDESQKNFIVRNGVVIDTNFMPSISNDNKNSISAYKSRLTLYLHLLPIPKKGPLLPLSVEETKKIIMDTNFNNDVS